MKREELEALIGDSEDIDEVTLFEKIKEAEAVKTVLEKEKESTVNLKLENWKRENLEKIKEEYKKEYAKKASKTPEQIKLEELELKVQTMEFENNLKALKLIATRELQNNGISIDFLDFVVDKDEDTTKNKIYRFRDAIKEEAQRILNEDAKAFIKKPETGLSGMTGGTNSKNYAGRDGMAAYLADRMKNKK